MESHTTEKNKHEDYDIKKGLIVQHLEKWYKEKRKAADGRWFVISGEGDPKLDPALIEQLKKDAEILSMLIKERLSSLKTKTSVATVIASLFESSDAKSAIKYSEKLNEAFDAIFKKLDTELASDTDNLWLINSNKDKKLEDSNKDIHLENSSQDIGPEAARKDIFKSYIFALQKQIITLVYGDVAKFSNVPDTHKTIIKDLYDQAGKYYTTYSEAHPVFHRRMGF